MSISVVTLGPGTWDLVDRLERLHGDVTVVRRCLDLSELIACAHTGMAHAALVAEGAEDLTASLLGQLADAGLRVLVVEGHDAARPALGVARVPAAATGAEVAELIREAALTGLHEELPHSVAVQIDEVLLNPTREDVLNVHAVIFVEREGQKAILRGKDGRRLSKTVHDARQQIMALVGQNVYLDVRLKVAKNWQSDPKQLGRLGF